MGCHFFDVDNIGTLNTVINDKMDLSYVKSTEKKLKMTLFWKYFAKLTLKYQVVRLLQLLRLSYLICNTSGASSTEVVNK